MTAAAVPMVVVIPDIFIRGKWKIHVSLSHVTAITLGILVYLLPFLYASITADGYGQSGLALAFRENLQRFFNAFDHKEPFYCYLYYVPFLFLPWIFFVGGAILDRFRGFRGLSDVEKWLSLAVLGIFFLFTLSSSRRSYYILPIIPFLSLFTADFVLAPQSIRIREISVKAQTVFLAAAGLIALFSPLLIPLIRAWTGFEPPPELWLSAFAAGAFCLMCLVAGRSGFFIRVAGDQMSASLASLVLAGLVLLGAFFCFQQNSLEIYRTNKPFLLELKKNISDIPPERIGLSKNMAFVLFYLDARRPLWDLAKHANLEHFLHIKGKKIIIARKRDAKRILPALPAGSYRQTLAARTFPWSRRNEKRLVAWEVF
ncbi:MAG: hypothetical protein DSZ23_05800 [Thermodesulfatator sp.]|nr:MAG: hypothetical protein DSZ23_05800 [Thermodesulfatator sp.]